MGAPHNIEIGASRYDIHLLELHDILQLYSDFSGFPEQFWMEEMAHCPIIPMPQQEVSLHQGLESK